MFELIDKYGDELTNAAIKRAGQNGITKTGALGYVTSILENWKTKNVTTIEQAREETRHFMAEKQTKSFDNRKVVRKVEPTPKWAGSDNQSVQITEAEKTANQARIDELMKKVSEG